VKKSAYAGRAMVGIMAFLLVFGVLAGCATRGFVRNEVADLRQSMVERTDGLADELAEVRNSADAAFERAQVAYGSAVEARDLALGNLGFRQLEQHSVQFGFDSAELDASATAALDEVAAQIQSRPDLIVDIYGFADPTGAAEYNLQLGQRRADAVRRYLVGQTVGPMTRYAAISFGETRSSRAAQDLLDNGAEQRRVVVSLFERTSPSDQETHAEEDSPPEFN
jgi:outer membrane protein OmpA-like peptidoglycan-associated protein